MFLLHKHWRQCMLLWACLPAWAAPPAWQAPIDLAHGPGERGPWRQNESRFRYVDDGTVRFGANGTLYTAWVDQVKKDVLFQRRNAKGQAEGPPLNISRSPETFSWLPRIATLPGQPHTVLVLWQEIIFAGGAHGGDIMLARSVDAGKSFAAPLNLSASIGGDGKGRINKDIWDNGSQDIVAGPDGVVHAAWTEYDGQLWYARSSDGAERFSTPRQIAGSARLPARAPSLAVDSVGRLYLAFTTGEDAASDIHLMASEDGGQTFSRPRVVEQTPGYSDAPKLAVDDAGVLHLAWAESRGGPFDRQRIRYARSRDRGARFEASREMPVASKGEASSAFPSLGVQGRQITLLWETLPTVGVRPRGLAMAVSDDSGERFDRPFMVPHSVDAQGGGNGSVQGLLMNKLAVDAQGRIAVVNSALREGHGSRVWLMQGRLPARREQARPN